MPDLDEAWAFLERSERISSAEEVSAAIRRVAAEIEARLRKAYPLVLVVMGGAVVFAGQLLPLLRFPLDFDYIHASRYGPDTQGGGVAWRVEISAAALRALRKIAAEDCRRIDAAILALRDEPRPRGVLKVQGSEGLWRIRVGDYRVIYEIHETHLLVLVIRVRHRSGVYK